LNEVVDLFQALIGPSQDFVQQAALSVGRGSAEKSDEARVGIHGG